MNAMTKYRVSDQETDIERFSNGEDALVIEWNGESRTLSTFTRGTTEPLYVGKSMEAARASLELDNDEWDSLLLNEVEYLTD